MRFSSNLCEDDSDNDDDDDGGGGDGGEFENEHTGPVIRAVTFSVYVLTKDDNKFLYMCTYVLFGPTWLIVVTRIRRKSEKTQKAIQAMF